MSINPFAMTYAELKSLNPCADEFASVTAILGDENSWDGRLITATEARAAGVSMDQVIWAASALARKNSEIERRLQHWGCDCAARVLAIFEKQFPGDGRPRAAIEAGRHFADGLIGAAEWAAARNAAEDAARISPCDAAWSAARAAAWAAASTAAMDAGWRSAWSAAWDAARAAAEAAKAAAGSAAWSAASDAAWDAEQDWQFTRLCEWMSDAAPQTLEISGDEK